MPTDAPNPPAPVPAPDEWRTRAEAAEGRLHGAEAKLAEVEKQLAESRAALDSTERKRQIERELIQADAIDLESVTLLTEAAVGAMSKPDVALAVKDLKKRKPFLFRGHSAVSGHTGANGTGIAGPGAAAGAPGARPSAMAGVPRSAPDDLAQVADEARTSGDRATLLRYLRLKRAS